MANPVVYFTGDFMATTPSQPTNHLNPSDTGFGMTINNAQPLGSSNTIYRLEWFQNVGSSPSFANGQIWRLEQYSGPANPTTEDLAEAANWSGILKTNLIPKPDLVAGLGLSGDWAVFENQGPGGNGEHLVLRFDGPFPSEPGTITLEAPRDANNNLIKTPPSIEDINTSFTESVIDGAVCFAAGTMISTAVGDRAVEDLREGDLVLTRDHGLQRIRWIGSRRLDARILAAKPNLQPVRISAGALGDGLPIRDLLVSPQHRILLRSAIAQRMFGTHEVLVAAKQLLPLDGVDIASDVTTVEYFHIMFDRHEVIISNGAETESLYTGPQALKSLKGPALEEIFAIFPELRDPDHAVASARFLVSGRQARKLVARHLQHGKPLTA